MDKKNPVREVLGRDFPKHPADVFNFPRGHQPKEGEPELPILLRRLELFQATREVRENKVLNAQKWFINTPSDHPRYRHRKEVWEKELAKLRTFEATFWELNVLRSEAQQSNPRSQSTRYEDEAQARQKLWQAGWKWSEDPDDAYVLPGFPSKVIAKSRDR